MPRLPIRLTHAARHPDFPAGDDALGHALWKKLVAKLPLGLPRPVLVTLFADTAQVVDLPPILESGADVHQATAAFASQRGAEAVATVGVMIRRRDGRPNGRFAMVFVEWPDGRWWSCSHPLDGAGQLLVGVPHQVNRAVDGAPKPIGLGAWFRRARYEEIKLKLGTDAVN